MLICWYKEKIMRKIVSIALAAMLIATTAAQADGWGHRPGPCNFNNCYGRGYGEYRGGGGNWAAPLVGGLIIGGMLGAMSQPRGYQEQPAYHTECRWEQMYDQWGNYLGNGRRCYNVPNY
jgi:hypothetical protein